MKRIEPDRPITFRLVIEVEPYHWSSRPTPPPIECAEEHRAEWSAYFQKCMSDAGFLGVDPIQPGSLFVDAFTVVENELVLRMIRENLEIAGLPGYPDEHGREDGDAENVPGLAGGFAVFGADELLLEPQCCSEFCTLKSWQEAILDRPTEADLWIGHPHAKVSFHGESVTIGEGCDGQPPPDDLVEFSIGVDELREAVDRAEEAARRFERRLLTRVGELVADPVLAPVVCCQLMATGSY